MVSVTDRNPQKFENIPEQARRLSESNEARIAAAEHGSAIVDASVP